MPFQLKWTEEAVKGYEALKSAADAAVRNRAKSSRSKSSRQEGLFKQVAGAIAKLKENPRHPSLNCHHYSDLPNPYAPKDKVWEAYAQNKTPGAYRIFWCYGPGKAWITILAITPHP